MFWTAKCKLRIVRKSEFWVYILQLTFFFRIARKKSESQDKSRNYLFHFVAETDFYINAILQGKIISE